MSERLKKQIEGQLRTFADSPLREAGTNLLHTLGYHSRRTSTPGIDAERYRRLRQAARTATAADTLRSDDWDAFHFLFQLTDEEMHAQQTVFETQAIDDALMRSYLFAALKLSGDAYTRTQLVNITRFINKQLPQPIMVMFQYGHFLTLAIINRRWDKRKNPCGSRGGHPREGDVNQGHSSAFTASGASGHPRRVRLGQPRPHPRRSLF